jgi:ribonucleoside-triphosphate reductase
MENVKNVENNMCHDCSKKIDFEHSEIKNGVLLAYNHKGKKINVFKCNECFLKNKSLTNFQECEVYSRVVGYIRPVQQWHKGKKQEFEERKEFLAPKGVVNS